MKVGSNYIYFLSRVSRNVMFQAAKDTSFTPAAQTHSYLLGHSSSSSTNLSMSPQSCTFY